LNIQKDITKKFVGSQYSSIMNAYSGDSLAGATWPTSWEAWCKENPEMAKQMEVVWQTEPLVNSGFVVRDDVDPDVANKVAELLIKLDTHDTGKQMLQSAGLEGFEVANNKTYDVVEDFLNKFNTAIGQE